MKYIFTIFFNCATALVFSQNITQDTTLANQYFTKADTEDLSDSLKMDLLTKAVELYEKYQITDKLIESKSLMAYVDIDNAPELAEAAFQLAKETYQTDLHPTLLYAYRALQNYYTIADVTKGVEYGEKAVQVVQKPSDKYYTIAFFLIGDYCYNYQVDDAQKLLEEVERLKAEYESESTSKLNVKIYRAHLQIKIKQGNLESAIAYGKKCIAENEKYSTYKNEALGTIYVEVGNCYAELGRLEEAIDWMKKGLEVADLPPNDPKIGTYYANIALAFYNNGDSKSAIEYNEKAIELFLLDEEFYGQSLMSILYNTSVYYYQLGDLENALQAIKKSYEYGQHYLLHKHHANILSNLENYPEALQNIQKALIMLSPNFDSEDIAQTPGRYEEYLNTFWAGNALTGKAGILTNFGIEEQSEKHLKQAIEVSELAIQVQSDFLNQLKGFEAARMTYSKEIYKSLQHQARANQELYKLTEKEQYLHDYFKTTERLKAMSLLQVLTPSSLPQEVVAKEEKMLHSLRLLQQKTETAEADSLAFFQNQLFDVTQEYEAFVRQLRQDFPKETGAFYNLEYATVSDIQTQLRADELYIDYAYDNKSLRILSISKASAELEKVDIDQQFSEALTAMQESLKDPLLMQRAKKESFIETSHQLYEYLLLPIAHRLKDKSKITIAPEKELFYLPFEVLLPTDEIKGFEDLDFWVKKCEISYQYSATIFRQLQKLPSIKDNSLLAFAPIFENEEGSELAARDREILPDSLVRSVEGDRFRPLPNSKKEVNTISQILSKKGQTKVLTENEASKNNLISALTAQSYQFLHIATHGIVNFNNPKLSALACFQNESSDENLLYANEIQLQDIQADLVVLSSCESGIGRLVKGEGLLALSRSFIYAGAKNVLFSLWKVNDRHTSTLMIDFYKFYSEGASYSEALRKAKLKMLENPVTANPNYWSPFVLIGE